MKLTLTIIVSLFIFIGCDNNDDLQTNVALPTDGFTINNAFFDTANAYITIDQLDGNADGFPDHYNFYFTDGRITDTFGDIGVGYQYAFSTNSTTKLAVIKVMASQNVSLTTGIITAGTTYIGSSLSTMGANFTSDSVIAYNVQMGPVFGTENGFTFGNVLETSGIWNYVGTTGPSVTVNAIHIDNNTPANSTIDVNYTFLNSNGITITGHYEGTLGLILD